ncbi:unnamed protein product [Boreogadus saida]
MRNTERETGRRTHGQDTRTEMHRTDRTDKRTETAEAGKKTDRRTQTARTDRPSDKTDRLDRKSDKFNRTERQTIKIAYPGKLKRTDRQSDRQSGKTDKQTDILKETSGFFNPDPIFQEFGSKGKMRRTTFRISPILRERAAAIKQVGTGCGLNPTRLGLRAW